MDDKKLLKEDALYRFFTHQIYKVDYEINIYSDKLNKLSREQEELKKGKTELVKLRCELVQRLTKNKCN